MVEDGKARQASGRWSRQRQLAVSGALVLLLLASLLLALCLGTLYIDPLTAVRGLWASLVAPERGDAEADPVLQVILTDIRLPRALGALVVGAALAMAGATFQALFRNPMADPFVLGVSAGASLGAATAVYLAALLPTAFGGTLGGLARLASGWGISALAFVGALSASAVVVLFSRRSGRIDVLRLLICGLAINAFLSALVSLLTYLSREHLPAIVFWIMGSLQRVDSARLIWAAPYLSVGLGVLAVHVRQLNILLMGDERATSLGIDVEKTKLILITAACLLTATAVSMSGIIGFVGLIVPHMMRLLVGPNHRVLLPLVGLGGGILLLLADVLARTVLAPTELPIGIVTSLLGGPFFLYLLQRRRPGQRIM